MANEPWRLVESTTALDAGWLEVLEKTYELPGVDDPQTYYVVSRADFVLVVATVDNELLLVKQYRPGTDQFHWALPAGYVQTSESYSDAARRELKEETGYRAVNPVVVAQLDPLPGYVKSTAHVITCSVDMADSRSVVEEVVAVSLIAWDNALEMIRSGYITEMQAVAAILLVNELRAMTG